MKSKRYFIVNPGHIENEFYNMMHFSHDKLILKWLYSFVIAHSLYSFNVLVQLRIVKAFY